MTSNATNTVKAAALIVLGLAIAVMGIYVANADDAPGAAVIGFLLMLAAILSGLWTARNRLPTWAGRAALAVAVLVAAFSAFLTHAVTVATPLFAQPPDVPSVIDSAPPPQYAPAVERARELVRAAVLEQNLPGVSVAVGTGLTDSAKEGSSVGAPAKAGAPAGAPAKAGSPAGAPAKAGAPVGALAKAGSPAGALAKAGSIVWAEGFGWRDVDTRTPVTPATRFHIGTAASVVTPAAAASLGLTGTGVDTAADWSPEHVGEPEEDFPPFTIIRHAILQPLGLAPPEYPLPGERATFYVPRSEDHDPRRGRRLMYMRDLACCAGEMAFYSTPSDLVRFALATKAESVTGELAGGSMVSLTTRRDRGIVVAVASNIAYAGTAALAQRVADVFAGQK